MSITINGSGTLTGISAGGYPDATVTADDLAATLDLSGKTVTLPSDTGGKILQVVFASMTTDVQTSSTSYADTGITASITPSSTSSKVFVSISHNGYLGGNGEMKVGGRILRDSTEVWQTDLLTFRNSSEVWKCHVSNVQVLDSPSSTSSLTYKFQVKRIDGSDSMFFDGGSLSSNFPNIVLMEVAG